MKTQAIEPVSAYENAHLVARDMIERVLEMLELLPSPDSGRISWGHVGSLNHVNSQLSGAVEHLESMMVKSGLRKLDD